MVLKFVAQRCIYLGTIGTTAYLFPSVAAATFLPLLAASLLYGHFYGTRLKHEHDGWLLCSFGLTVNQWVVSCVRCLIKELGIIGLIMNHEANQALSRIGEGHDPGGVCFLGDSEFGCWHRLREDMSSINLPVIPAGFGGSRTWDLIANADKLCLRWKPRAVVLHCAGNDWDFWTGTGQVADLANTTARNLINLTHRLVTTPGVDTVILLLTPRRSSYCDTKWQFLQQVSNIYEEEFKSQSTVHIINLRMEGIDHPASHYRMDKSHLNWKGHQLEAKYILPKLKALLSK